MGMRRERKPETGPPGDPPMHPFRREFSGYLEAEDKARCVEATLDLLSSGGIDLETLYEEVLAPALNEMECEEPEEVCIWREHVRSAIVRTVLECCYPSVLEARRERYGDRTGPRALVLCPPEEPHEIGARLVADALTLRNYEVTYVGANTPREAFLSALELCQPAWVAVSTSNYYNLVATKKVIAEVRHRIPEAKVVVGGRAFQRDPEAWEEVGADAVAHSFEDLDAVLGGG